MNSSESRSARAILDVARGVRRDHDTLRHWIGPIERAWASARKDPRLAIEFVWVLDDFFRLEGLSRQYLSWASVAIEAAQRLRDRKAEGILLTNIGWIQSRLGNTRSALRAVQRAITLLKREGVAGEEAAARHNLGLILLERHGRTNAARKQFESALNLARKSRHWRGQAKVLSSLANLEWRIGNPQRGLALLDKAYGLFTRHRDLEGQATTLNTKGILLSDLGRNNEARTCYQRSLVIRKRIGDRSGMAQALDNLGVLDFENGNFGRALNQYHQAIQIEETIHDVAGLKTTLNNIAFLYEETDRPAQALPYYWRALEVADSMRSRVDRATTLTMVALSQAATGDVAGALRSLDEALKIHRATGDKGWQAATLHNRGLIHRRQLGDPRGAIRYARRALIIQRAIGIKDAEKRTREALAAAQQMLAVVMRSGAPVKWRDSRDALGRKDRAHAER
jgi:tetratricopeptide (TPR) repeat protein